MKACENNLRVIGVLSEVDLQDTTFTKNGQTREAIRGTIKVRVDQKINGEDVSMEVPLSAFAARYTNAGTENPAYLNLKEVMTNMTSIAACGDIEQADCVRITRGSLQENVFYAKNGELVNMTRLNANFINKIPRAEMVPEATFTTTIVVGAKTEEIGTDGMPTGRLNINGVVIQYADRADLVKFVVANENAKNHIEQYWNDGDTVKVQGKINFSSKTEWVEEEVGFGEPIRTPHTTSVHELIIESGSAGCLEGEAAYDIKEVQTALAARKVRIEDTKKPAATAAAPKPNFGF